MGPSKGYDTFVKNTLSDFSITGKESDFNERSLSRIYLSLKFEPPRYCDIDDIGSFHKCVVLI